MRADHALLHNAAVGALLGLAVADAVSRGHTPPPVVTGGVVELPPWSEVTERSLLEAERVLRGHPVDMGLSATDIVATAIRLSRPDASPPLLGDGDAVLMCALVRDALAGRLDLDAGAGGPAMLAAQQAVLAAPDFADAVGQALATDDEPHQIALIGAIAGLRWGPAAIPAAWATTVHGPVGARSYGLRQLRRLAERLLQLDAPAPPEPRRSVGPREVAPRLWVSNLHAVPRFVAEYPDGAVISLCPTTGAFDHHPVRREFAIHDAGGRTVNPLLAQVVDEVLGTIRAFHDEGRHVLVHCHHGASRTGLILRAWLIDELGLDEDDAATEALARWSKTSTWNQAFSAEIRRRAATTDRSL